MTTDALRGIVRAALLEAGEWPERLDASVEHHASLAPADWHERTPVVRALPTPEGCAYRIGWSLGGAQREEGGTAEETRR